MLLKVFQLSSKFSIPVYFQVIPGIGRYVDVRSFAFSPYFTFRGFKTGKQTVAFVYS